MNYEKARKAVIALLRLESGILAAILIYLIVASITSTVTTWSALIGEMVFAALGSTGMYFASIGYVKEKSFGRSPAVLANLIALGVSYFMITGKFYVVGIPLALLAATTLYCAIKGYKES
jgi:hypothetical protein